jgi:nicotinate dehydrogenase large molybdopterin subunit
VNKKPIASPMERVQQTPSILHESVIAPLVTYPIEVVSPGVRQQTPAVGQRATRLDCHLHGLGQTKYIDDLRFPGMLYAKIKRAGVASARIKSIDTKEAESMPGVMAVLTGKDIPCNSFGPSIKDQPVLACERVFHAGDGVAAVAAVTEQIAAEAVEKIKIEYEVLPPVLDPLESLKLETPGVHAPSANIYQSRIIKKGDIEKGFAASDHIVEGQFRTQMAEHAPLEPHAAIGMWDPNGRVTIYSTLGRITLGRADVEIGRASCRERVSLHV